jgi:hypothetical protein
VRLAELEARATSSTDGARPACCSPSIRAGSRGSELPLLERPAGRQLLTLPLLPEEASDRKGSLAGSMADRSSRSGAVRTLSAVENGLARRAAQLETGELRGLDLHPDLWTSTAPQPIMPKNNQKVGWRSCLSCARSHSG